MLARLRSLPARLSALAAAHPVAYRVAFAAVVFALLAVTVVRYREKVREPNHDGFTKSAFLRWRPQLLALDRGEDIYLAHRYPNPPVMALILRPFAALPLEAGALTWLLFKAGLAAVGFAWALRLAAEPGHAFPRLAVPVVAWLSIHPVIADLQHNNVNIFIAFLLFAALELVRRRWDAAAGVVLALAIACKVTPALFVVYFGWKVLLGGWSAVRDKTPLLPTLWKSGGAVLAGCGVGLILWLVVVPGLALGFERNTALLKSWYATMAKPFVEQGKVRGEIANQSLPGLAHGFLTSVPLDDDPDSDERSKRRGTLADLGPDAAKWVVRGCQGVFALAVLLLARAPLATTRRGVRLAAECGFIALGMLLFSERTWKHHATTTALPMAAVVGFWVFRAPGPALRWLLFALLAAATVLMTGPSLLPDKWQEECLDFGTHAAAFVLLAVAVGVVMAWETRTPASPQRTQTKPADVEDPNK